MQALEHDILSGSITLFNSYKNHFALSGVTWRNPEIIVHQSDTKHYTSEFRTIILKSGEVDDVLEFLIYENGQAMVTLKQALDWLNEQIKALDIC